MISRIIAFSTLLCLTLSQSFQWTKMGVYIEKNFDWSNVENEFRSAIDAGYNRIYVGFYMSMYGCQGGCTAWDALGSQVQQDVLGYAHSNGAQIWLSVGGPGEFVEGVIQDGAAATFGADAAQFAVGKGFDGIDFYSHLSGEKTTPSVVANNGSFAGYVGTLISQAKLQGFTSDQLTITSNAPYFSPDFIDNSTALSKQYALSWFALDANKNNNQYVGSINALMFNEDGNYMTYSDIFIANTYTDPYYGVFGTGSAVKQLSQLGINPNKISIVKPLSPAESSVSNGYIDAATLGSYGCQAYGDFQWTGGYVGWTWSMYDSYNTLNWPTLLGTC